MSTCCSVAILANPNAVSAGAISSSAVLSRRICPFHLTRMAPGRTGLAASLGQMKLRLEADVRVRVERALQEREQLVVVHLSSSPAKLQQRVERVELFGEAMNKVLGACKSRERSNSV